MNERTVREIIAHHLHTHQEPQTAPLDAEKVDRILALMTQRMVQADFGLTITQDHNGAWGPLGQRLLTLRFGGDSDDHFEASLVVRSVTSRQADKAHMDYLQEDK